MNPLEEYRMVLLELTQLESMIFGNQITTTIMPLNPNHVNQYIIRDMQNEIYNLKILLALRQQ